MKKLMKMSSFNLCTGVDQAADKIPQFLQSFLQFPVRVLMHLKH